MAFFLHVVNDHMNIYCIKYSLPNESKRTSNYVSIDALDGCTQKRHIIYPIFLEIAVEQHVHPISLLTHKIIQCMLMRQSMGAAFLDLIK